MLKVFINLPDNQRKAAFFLMPFALCCVVICFEKSAAAAVPMVDQEAMLAEDAPQPVTAPPPSANKYESQRQTINNAALSIYQQSLSQRYHPSDFPPQTSANLPAPNIASLSDNELVIATPLSPISAPQAAIVGSSETTSHVVTTDTISAVKMASPNVSAAPAAISSTASTQLSQSDLNQPVLPSKVENLPTPSSVKPTPALAAEAPGVKMPLTSQNLAPAPIPVPDKMPQATQSTLQVAPSTSKTNKLADASAPEKEPVIFADIVPVKETAPSAAPTASNLHVLALPQKYEVAQNSPNKSLATISTPLPPPESSVNSELASPETGKALAEQIETLERENQSLREKLHIGVSDPLQDIEVDAVAQIRENVLRQRIKDLETQMDKLSMKNDNTPPSKTIPDQPAPAKKNHLDALKSQPKESP